MFLYFTFYESKLKFYFICAQKRNIYIILYIIGARWGNSQPKQVFYFIGWSEVTWGRVLFGLRIFGLGWKGSKMGFKGGGKITNFMALRVLFQPQSRNIKT